MAESQQDKQAWERSQREIRILECLKDATEDHGFSLRELAKRVAAPLSTTHDDLVRLLAGGDVVRAVSPAGSGPSMYGLARSCRLSRKGAERIGASALPIAAEVAAGQPRITFDPYPGGTRTLKDALSLGPDDYLLEVQGQSMVDMGYHPGDLLIIHAQTPQQVSQDEVVVVAVRDQGTTDEVGLTLKRWHREGDRVRLHPAHLELEDHPDAYRPLEYDAAEVNLCGKLAGTICPADHKRTRGPWRL
jgi:SOS-response transcriptional repressor LexA